MQHLVSLTSHVSESKKHRPNSMELSCIFLPTILHKPAIRATGFIHTSSIGVVMMVVVMLVMHPSCILPATRRWPSCSSRWSAHLVGSSPARTPSPLGTSHLHGKLVGLVGMTTWVGLALVRASVRVKVVESLKKKLECML